MNKASFDKRLKSNYGFEQKGKTGIRSTVV